MKGLRAAWLHEASFRLEVACAVLLLPLAFLVRVDGSGRALLVLSVLAVLAVERLDPALEAVVDRFGPDWNERSGRAKDMGSAAVLLAITAAAAAWILVVFA